MRVSTIAADGLRSRSVRPRFDNAPLRALGQDVDRHPIPVGYPTGRGRQDHRGMPGAEVEPNARRAIATGPVMPRSTAGSLIPMVIA